MQHGPVKNNVDPWPTLGINSQKAKQTEFCRLVLKVCVELSERTKLISSVFDRILEVAAKSSTKSASGFVLGWD
jgi:hypothetical protein